MLGRKPFTFICLFLCTIFPSLLYYYARAAGSVWHQGNILIMPWIYMWDLSLRRIPFLEWNSRERDMKMKYIVWLKARPRQSGRKRLLLWINHKALQTNETSVSIQGLRFFEKFPNLSNKKQIKSKNSLQADDFWKILFKKLGRIYLLCWSKVPKTDTFVSNVFDR